MLPCLFCESAAGDLPQSVVYEDAEVLAFLDWRQTAPGHVLVIPRRHLSAEDLFADPAGPAVLAAAIRVAGAVRDALSPDGVQMGAILIPGDAAEARSSGRATATPAAPETAEDGHFHLHVLPRHNGGTLARIYPFGDAMSRPQDLAELAHRLRAALRPHRPAGGARGAAPQEAGA